MKNSISILLILVPVYSGAGIYIETGLGVPLTPDSGYIPDLYGIAGLGYIHRIDDTLSLDLGWHHRSLTGSDNGMCGTTEDGCSGDNAIETKFRLEW